MTWPPPQPLLPPLILPGRHLRHVDCYVALSQAHDDVNLLQPSSTSKPPLLPPFPMDWMCIPGSGSSSGGGAILLVVLVLKAAARPPSTLPSMVGCCVPTPLSTAPILAAFVQRHAVVVVLAPVFVQSGQLHLSVAPLCQSALQPSEIDFVKTRHPLIHVLLLIVTFIHRCRHRCRWTTLPPPLHDVASTSTFVATAAD
jgi:hypothetical protein